MSGHTVLVTRAREQASHLVDRIRDLGGTVWEFPVIAIADPVSFESLDRSIHQIERYQWLVLTSRNGVERFLGRLRAVGLDCRAALAHLKIVAVGAVTAQALVERGLRPVVTPDEFRGSALSHAMRSLLTPGDRVLMARAELADPALAVNLRGLGAEVEDVVAYRTVPAEGDAEALKAALETGAISYVTLTSSSTVANLLARVGGPAAFAQSRIAVIGPGTHKAAEAAGLTVHLVAPRATAEDLVDAIAADVLQET